MRRWILAGLAALALLQNPVEVPRHGPETHQVCAIMIQWTGMDRQRVLAGPEMEQVLMRLRQLRYDGLPEGEPTEYPGVDIILRLSGGQLCRYRLRPGPCLSRPQEPFEKVTPEGALALLQLVERL